MRYVMARYQAHRREMAYRIYCTECLRIITENTAKISGGSYMKPKFTDLFVPKKIDNRTTEEIVADTIKNAGLEVL